MQADPKNTKYFLIISYILYMYMSLLFTIPNKCVHIVRKCLVFFVGFLHNKQDIVYIYWNSIGVHIMKLVFPLAVVFSTMHK